MIPKVWLAAFLGVLLGLGMTYSTSVPVTPAANMKLPAQTFEVNRQTSSAATQPAQSNSQLLLLSLLAGIIVATPAFLIAKKRS